MATSVIQHSFSAGEIAPSLYGRTDFQKYSAAATTARNGYINYRGGFYSRAGTAYCLKSLTSPGGGIAPPRVITFQFSITQGYALELGNQYMRFFFNGAPITETAFSISGATQANPCQITLLGHGYSTGDWIFLSGIVGMTQLNNRFYVITVTSANTFTLFSLFGLGGINSTTYGAYVSGGVASRVYTLATPWSGVDVAALKFTQSADVMSFTHPNYPPFDLARISNNSWTITEANFNTTQDAPGAPTVLANVQPDPSTSPPTLPCAYAYVVTAINIADEESIASGRGDVLDSVNMAVTQGANRILWISADGAVRYNVYRAPAGFNPDPSDPTHLALPVPTGAIFSYIGSTVGNEFIDANIIPDTTKSPPRHKNPFAPGQILLITMTTNGSGYTTATPTITTGTGTGFVGTCVIVSDFVAAVIVIEAGEDYLSTDTLVITGDGAGAGGTLLVGPQTGTFPSLVAYYQQRRVYAASNNTPDTYYMSRPGQYLNFDTSFPSVPDDAISGTPWAQQVNGIQWMVQMPGGLLTFTGKGAWQIQGAGGSGFAPGPITPSSQIAQQVMFNGISAMVPPIAINFDVLYVQSKGTKVLDATYNFITSNYTGTDQTVLCSHLFSGFDITEWAWCEEPNKIIWALRCDGVLLSFTYLKEQEVYGWARHDTNGTFRSVTAVTEPPVDALYCVTERYPPGGPAYIIERFDNRIWESSEDPWCVDAGLAAPMAEKTVALLATAITGAVNFISIGGNVFDPTMVGAILRIAGGIATLGNYVSATQMPGTWNLSPSSAVQTGGTWSFLACADKWTVARPTIKVYGLDHLVGLSVTGLVDGIVLPPTVVAADSSVTFPFEVSNIKIGLPFTAQVQTPYLDTGNPTVQGRRKDIVAVTVRVDSSATPDVGSNQPDGGAQVPPAIAPPWTNMFPAVTADPDIVPTSYLSPAGQPVTKLFSGDFRANIKADWDERGQTAVQQTQPLPLSVVAVIPEVLEGDTSEQTYSDKQRGNGGQGDRGAPGMWMLRG